MVVKIKKYRINLEKINSYWREGFEIFFILSSGKYSIECSSETEAVDKIKELDELMGNEYYKKREQKSQERARI